MDEFDKVFLLVLIFALIPGLVAVVRKHSYTWVIIAISVASIFAALIAGPVALIVWVVAFVWAVWPERAGFVSPLIDSTSAAVGHTLGGHRRDYDETSSPEDLLLKMKRLKDEGIVSDEEYQKLRDTLVDKMMQ